MGTNILVTYASKYGATAEIAEKIGEGLRQAGLPVEVTPVDGVRDLNAYPAVVLGSALYVGKWNKAAEQFLKANVAALAERPVWIFSSGPTGEGDPVQLVEGQRLPANLRAAAERIKPRDITVFHGNIDPAKINFIETFAVRSIVKKPFGDYRDWPAIEAWAKAIAAELKKAG